MTEPVPGHQQCARADCEARRTAEGKHQYCSALCLLISHVTHAGPLPALPEWSWAPGPAERYR